MKKTLLSLCLIAIVILSSSSISVLDKNGRAGNTGSPGEATCAGGGCHNGGAPASFSVTISSVPAFTLNQFVPGTTYTMSIDVAATGYNLYGFGCEILNGLNANSGTMQLPGAGVKFLNISVSGNSRRNATHTAPKSGTGLATFSFQWVAPTVDTIATIYVCGNAVNGNNSTSGDKPIPNAPLQLTAYKDTNHYVSVKELSANSLSNVSFYPNPSADLVKVSFTSSKPAQLQIVLCDLNGKIIKPLLNEEVLPGNFSKILDVHDVAAGAYFLKISEGQYKLSQKLLLIE